MSKKFPGPSAPAIPPPRLALAVALALALGGLAVALLLVRIHGQAHAGISSFCAISETMNCDKVATSPYSVVFRLPVAVWGALGYALAALLAGWGLTARRLHPRWPAGLLLLFGLASVGASVALAFVSHVLIGAWCLLCMASWSISLAMLVTAYFACRGSSPLGAVRADLGALAAVPRRTSAALVLGAAAVLALASFYPRYWDRARAAQVLSQTQPPGAPGTTPAAPAGPLRDPAAGAIVYSDYECPYCRIAHGELKVVLSHRPDIKVVKRHFPLDQACNPIIKRPMHLNACNYARAAICAEAQGHFEAMDDALFDNQARRPVEELAARLGLDVKRFQACLVDPATGERLKADIAAAVADDIKATPTYLVGGVQYAGKLPVEVFQPAKGAPPAR